MDKPMTCRLTTLSLAGAIAFFSLNDAWGEPPAKTQRVVVTDSELDANGTWQGVVVTPQGVAVPRAHLQLWSAPRKQIASVAVTNETGRFRFERVRPGSYTLRCDEEVRIYRLWKSGTAPPAAGNRALVVLGDAVTRGKLYDWAAAHPAITYVGIAAAIAVPFAVIDQDSSPASP
jgi:hypothetical protein